VGPSCSENGLFETLRFEDVYCYGRAITESCLENNRDMGMGDGCGDYSDMASCEAYKDGERRADESYDGSTKHCRWAPALTTAEKETVCESDGDCTFNAEENGPGGVPGECEASELQRNKSSAWSAQRGMECEKRTKHGCFENNEWLGDDDKCTSISDETECVSLDEDCARGACVGTSTGDGQCADMHQDWQCANEPGCTFELQCCKWIPEPADMAVSCKTNGAGTADVCKPVMTKRAAENAPQTTRRASHQRSPSCILSTRSVSCSHCFAD